MSYTLDDLFPTACADTRAQGLSGLEALVAKGQVLEEDGRYELRGAVPPVLPSTGSGLNSAGGPLRGEGS